MLLVKMWSWMFPPKAEFVTVLPEQHVKVGEQIILRCEANTTQCEMSWEKDGQKLECVYGKHTMEQKDNMFGLVINNACERDEGVYTIKFKNRKDSSSCSALVTVEFSEWRKIQWSQIDMMNTLQAFKTRCDEVKELNFLLFGPVGAGKSSIINTIKTIFEGHLCVDFLAASWLSQCKSQTLTYEKCVLGKDGLLPLNFHDFKGLEENKSDDVDIKDVISALKGHMKEGYVLKPAAPLEPDSLYYNKDPKLGDRIHCLVNVIPADKISLMTNFLKTMKKIRKEASRLGIPQVIFMTRVDLGCPITKQDLRNIHKSRKIKDKMQKCSIELGVPMNCIFPVWNYHEETDMKEDINCLMLYALTKIVHFGGDYVYKNNKKKTEF